MNKISNEEYIGALKEVMNVDEGKTVPMNKLTDEQIEFVRDQLGTATPRAVGYRLMIKPIPARKGMEAVEASKFKALAKAGFESKTTHQQERESHGSDVGVVMDLGDAAYKFGRLADREPWCKVGDVVMFPRYVGHIAEVPPGSGDNYHFMTDDDLIGKYEGIEL